MGRDASGSGVSGPAKVARWIIERRLAAEPVEGSSDVFRCTRADAHRLLNAESLFVMFKPRAKNYPSLWPDVLSRMADGVPLLYSKVTQGSGSLHTWVLPRSVVAQMDAILGAETAIQCKRDTDMVLEEQEWFWRPAGKDRHRRRIPVTSFYQEWKLSAEEAKALRDAFDTHRK